ncbi:MAG: protease complex subunit PrcB family protein, partial [Thiohalorhabdaceae bacterium]
PGYRLTLAGDEIGFPSDDSAVIRVHWTEPDPGKVQAQVVTRPCLLVALPRIRVERLRIRIEPSRDRVDGWRVSPPRRGH